EELVVLRGAVAVRGVERAREAAAPGAAVFADLAERLDHERVLPDALLHGRELARLDELRELRRFLEGLGDEGGIGDDLGAFELADERGAELGPLRDGGSDPAERNLARRYGERSQPQKGTPGEAGMPGSRGGPFLAAVVSLCARAW